MAFTIPNQSDAGTSSQAEVDAVDFGILVAAYNGTGVVAGGAVTAQSPTANMTVAVAAGTVLINGLHYGISAGNGTITTADSSNPRFDLITINTSGAIVVTAGTAASSRLSQQTMRFWPLYTSLRATQPLLLPRSQTSELSLCLRAYLMTLCYGWALLAIPP
jgi:hypothetical protein